LCVLLSTVVVSASTFGRVVVRHGQRVHQRDLAGCATSVSGFPADVLAMSMGHCYDPDLAQQPDGKGCSPGVLVPSSACTGDSKCCLYVGCQWKVPDGDPLAADFEFLGGSCMPQAQCASLPDRRVATSTQCSAGNMACCVSTVKTGTVGDAMDADLARVKELKSTPCNNNSGTCDPECNSSGTLTDDTGSSCHGGQCCVTSTSASVSSEAHASADVGTSSDSD